MIVNLTDEERKKFAMWLEQEADSLRKMHKAASDAKFPAVVLKKMEFELAACIYLYQKFINTETMTVGG